MAKFKFAAVVAVAAATSLALAGCSGGGNSGGNDKPTEPANTTPIKAVVFGGIGAEGILQANATTSVTAATASVNAVNEAGGIDGRKIELTVIDDKADPTQAVTKLRELLAGPNRPDVVMDSGPSTIADAIIPILSQEKIVSFNIGPTALSGDPKQSPYNFDLSPSVADYVSSFMNEIKTKGYKSVAVLHGSSPYGELFGKTAGEEAAKAGFTVTGNEGYDSKALDMTPQIEALKGGNPDVLILDAYGAPLGYVLDGIQKLGWNVPIMGNTSVAATGSIAKPEPDGVLGTDKVKNVTMQVFKSTKFNKDDARVNKAVEQMLAAGEIKSSLITAYNYDSMFLYKAAVESAKSLDAEAVAKAMLDPNVMKNADTAILQNYGFTAESHTPHAKPDEYLFIAPSPLKNGQFQ